MKYDLINATTSLVGEESEECFGCKSNGALGRDGCIYALAAYIGRGGRVRSIEN